MTTATGEDGRIFRDAWIAGVRRWTAQIYKHIPDPKPAYVADWPDLPDWQQQTNADIFEHIERDVADSPAN